MIHQVKKRNSSKIFSHDEGIINSVPLYKLMYASDSQSVDTKVATDVEKLKGKSKDLIDNYSEEEWDSDASDENDSSSIDDDNVNQDTLAIAEQLKPQFDSIEENDENSDTSLSKEDYEMDHSVRNEDSKTEDGEFHHRMIFQREKLDVAESEVEDGAETKNEEEVEKHEEQMKLERSDALAIFDKLCKPDASTEVKSRPDTGMVPLGQYATINTVVRYNPLAKDAYKFEIGGKPLTKAIPTDNDGSAKENSSKHDDVEVDSNALTPTNNADDENASAPERSFWTSKTNYWTSMFNDAAEKNKQGANTNTSASANFSVSSLFSLTSSDAAVKDVPDVTGDASVVSNKADGAASAGLENSVLFATTSSAVNVERQRNLEFLAKIKERIKPFCRESSLDEIDEKWREDRRELTLAFKRKYKMAMKIARKK